MSECSNAHIYINTLPADERVHIVKSKAEIKLLAESDPESDDIFVSNLYDHYVQRPDSL